MSATTPREVLLPADVRFPLERANGVQVVKTAAALARAGQPVRLIVRHSDPRPSPEILALYGLAPLPGLRIERLAVGHRRGAHHLPRLAFLARAGLVCALGLRRGALVFTRDLQLADWLLRCGRPRRVVYEAHAVEELMYRERGTLYGTGEPPSPRKAARLGRREGRVWRRAAGFVTTTAGIAESLGERHGARRAPWRVVPNGCDVPAERRFPGLPPGPPRRVLYAGQLYPWKGVDVLLEALVRVPELQLTLLGGLPGERDLERVRSLVRRLGLEERVEWCGTVPQARVAVELQRAAIVAVPFLRSAMTERHTSPLKLFEAMAAGRALVVSDLPSSREVLVHGHNALLVPPDDAPALAKALARLAHEPDLASWLARNAYADAERYSWDARARALGTLFAELV